MAGATQVDTLEARLLIAEEYQGFGAQQPAPSAVGSWKEYQDNGSGNLRLSVNGGPFFDFFGPAGLIGSAPGSNLQNAYVAGNVINLSAAARPVAITNTAAFLSSLLTVTQAAAVATPGATFAAVAGPAATFEATGVLVPSARFLTNAPSSQGSGGGNTEQWGLNALAQSANTTAVGSRAHASDINCTAIGYLTDCFAGSQGSTVVGAGSNSNGLANTVIGNSCSVGAGNGNVIVGQGTVVAAFNDTIAFGQAVAIGADGAIGIGSGSNATAQDTVAIGIAATASGTGNVAVGTSATASNAAGDGVAIGASATATGFAATAIGADAGATAALIGSVAVGFSATATGNRSLSIGVGTSAQAPASTCVNAQAIPAAALQSTAIGAAAFVSGAGSLAMQGANVSGNNAFGMGAFCTVAGLQSLGFGNGVVAAAATCVSIFGNIPAGATSAVCIGAFSTVTAAAVSAVCIGDSSSVTGPNGVAIGRGAVASATTTSVAIGDGASATGATESIAIGKASAGQYDICIGHQGASALGSSSISIGNVSTSGGTNGIAIGLVANASGTNGIAIGQGATASAPSAGLAIGNGPTASGSFSIAFGNVAVVSGLRAIAIGFLTSAAFTDSIALGGSATTTAANQLVVGSDASPITNIVFGADPVSGGVSTTTVKAPDSAGALGWNLILSPGSGAVANGFLDLFGGQPGPASVQLRIDPAVPVPIPPTLGTATMLFLPGVGLKRVYVGPIGSGFFGHRAVLVAN